MKTGFLIHKLLAAVISLAFLTTLAAAGMNHGSNTVKSSGQPADREATFSYDGGYSAETGQTPSALRSSAGSSRAGADSFAASQAAASVSPSVSSGYGPGTGSSAVVSAALQTSSSPLVAAAAAPPFVHPSKMVVGYYGGWAAYSGFTPDKISASNVHIIHYAFAKIRTDLKISINDPSIDYTNFEKLKSLKKSYPGLRTVISVGGWDDSGRFSDMALTQSSRAAFADSVVRFIKTYGFDGVDIDWEYPTGGGLASNIFRPADRTNFGLLLKTLRGRLDAQGSKDSKHYILSFAGAANSGYAAGVGLSGAAQSVDYATIMTYDLHGGWDSFTDFNAPLFLPAGQSPQYKTSVDSAVRTWLNYGFPAGKLVMGVPFYGYAYQGVTNSNNGLWQRFSSASAVGYDSIKSKYLSNASFQKFYDSAAQVPWLFNGSAFISWEDESSVRRKVQYAVSKNLLGVGAWELGFDRSGALIRTVKSTLD